MVRLVLFDVDGTHVHAGWQLQAQTNGLGTNWVNVAGSLPTNQMIVPLNSTNGSVFFRLVRPY